MVEKTIHKIQDTLWLASALALLGVALYFMQAWAYAHN
jgi:hypothetical protein